MRALALAVLLAVAGCDDRQALHEPHPSLERMQEQPRVDPFDARGMKPPPFGAVAIEEQEPVSTSSPPSAVDAALLKEGRTQFDRFCATCHGILGDGDSVVASKMRERPPPSLVDGPGAAFDRARVLQIIEQGYGLMPSLAHALPPRERWAAASYLEALRLRRRATARDLPSDIRSLAACEAAP